MRNENELRKRIAEIKADERYHYKPAHVLVNAPLAIIQIEMKTEVQALEWVLSKQ